MTKVAVAPVAVELIAFTSPCTVPSPVFRSTVVPSGLVKVTVVDPSESTVSVSACLPRSRTDEVAIASTCTVNDVGDAAEVATTATLSLLLDALTGAQLPALACAS